MRSRSHPRKDKGVLPERVDDIADDLGLDRDDVVEALVFEGLKPDLGRPSYWVN